MYAQLKRTTWFIVPLLVVLSASVGSESLNTHTRRTAAVIGVGVPRSQAADMPMAHAFCTASPDVDLVQRPQGLSSDAWGKILHQVSASCYDLSRRVGTDGDNKIAVQVAKLVASEASPGSFFGVSVSLSGDTVVVGAHGRANFTGAAYVYERNAGGVDSWGEVAMLVASDAATLDIFGISVSLSGDTVIVGAHRDDDACPEDRRCNSGAAYVYERNAGGVDSWGEVAKLTASDAAARDFFGRSVSVSRDTAVVGAWRDEDAGRDSGSTYVYGRNAGGLGNWGEVAKLTASDAASFDRFGWAVSVSGDTVVVGAHGDNEAGSFTGAAYIYSRDSGGTGNWGEVERLTASDAGIGDEFGFSVSISGGTVVVGSKSDDDACPEGIHCDSGSAYVYERNAGGADNWGEVVKLTASDAAAGDEFGFSISFSGGTVVVGAELDDDSCVEDIKCDSGSAYVYERNMGGVNRWGQVAKLTASDASAGDVFSTSVSIRGDTIIVGAAADDDPVVGSGTGSAYVFHLTSLNPVELLIELIENLGELGLHRGIENSLAVKLHAALMVLTDLAKDNDAAAINMLGAFIGQVEAQRGKLIVEPVADGLILDVQEIVELLGED